MRYSFKSTCKRALAFCKLETHKFNTIFLVPSFTCPSVKGDNVSLQARYRADEDGKSCVRSVLNFPAQNNDWVLQLVLPHELSISRCDRRITDLPLRYPAC